MPVKMYITKSMNLVQWSIAATKNVQDDIPNYNIHDIAIQIRVTMHELEEVYLLRKVSIVRDCQWHLLRAFISVNHNQLDEAKHHLDLAQHEIGDLESVFMLQDAFRGEWGA